MTLLDDVEKDRGAIARNWWRALQPHGNYPGDRAALARLRRSTLVSAMAEEATIQLFHLLGYRSPDRLPRVATLACILAFIREDDPTRDFARAIGRQKLSDPDSAAVKLLRFQRLIEAEGEEEILRGFRRSIDLIGHRANVADVGRLLLNFDEEEVRRRFTFNYYGAAQAARSTVELAPDPATPGA